MFNPHEYNPVHLNANIIKILWRQQQELLKHSPEYVTPIINNEDPLDIQIDLEGPKATPYESGKFRVKLLIPNDFPNVAPKGIFITKIFHPNISEKGEICVNTLKKDWNPRQWSLYNLFEVIKCLLIVPFPQSALNEEAGKIFMENYEEYFKIAQMYTKIYAMKNAKTNIKDDDGSEVHIGKDGIHVKDANDEVNINGSGIHVKDEDGHYVKIRPSREKKPLVIESIISSSMALLVTIAYLLLGFLLPDGIGWRNYWVLFFLIPIIPSIFEAIRKRKFCVFAYPLAATMVFLSLGMFLGLWHPTWVIFITIPVYYSIFGPIDRAIRDHNDKEYIIDNE